MNKMNKKINTLFKKYLVLYQLSVNSSLSNVMVEVMQSIIKYRIFRVSREAGKTGKRAVF